MSTPRITDEQVSSMHLPPFLRIEDAARILEVSRSTADSDDQLQSVTGHGNPITRYEQFEAAISLVPSRDL